MAFTLIQAGATLKLVDTAGTPSAALTLPTNIVLSTTRTPRFAIFGKYVVLVNSPNRPLTIDGLGTVRVLSPRPPGSVPVLSAQSGGALSGSYKVKQTFRVKDDIGNILAESDFGPITASQAVASQYLRAANLDLSPDSVSSSMLYRTTTGGIVFFPWVELNGNTQTSIQDDVSDAGLSLVAAAPLGSAPDLVTIASWRGRLWGGDRVDIDHLRYCEVERMSAWPRSNDILIPPQGADSVGIRALAPRREALGVGRRNHIFQVTGTSASDFRSVKVTENAGIESQESVVVYRDTAYFLWKDGVYAWDSGGIRCISDGKAGKGNVRSWFTTDSYFNRNRFANAIAQIDPIRNKYRLFLSAAGSSDLDRWVEYDLNEETWWGPHQTAAFTLVSAFVVPSANDVLAPMVGSSSGFMWQEQATRTDDTATAIDFDVDTKRHDGGTPNVDKVFEHLRMAGIAQTTGRLTVTVSKGELDASADSQVHQFELTKSSQDVGMVGAGKTAQLNFRENTAGQDVQLVGYELPFHELGVR